jgi:hypothetical protein
MSLGNSIKASDFEKSMHKRSNNASIISNPKLDIVESTSFVDFRNPHLLEKYKCRRILCYESPQMSTATIPKEFIINTSELRTIRKKVKIPGHTQSQH